MAWHCGAPDLNCCGSGSNKVFRPSDFEAGDAVRRFVHSLRQAAAWPSCKLCSRSAVRSPAAADWSTTSPTVSAAADKIGSSALVWVFFRVAQACEMLPHCPPAVKLFLQSTQQVSGREWGGCLLERKPITPLAVVVFLQDWIKAQNSPAKH